MILWSRVRFTLCPTFLPFFCFHKTKTISPFCLRSMEFFDLGSHCSLKSCNVQDFLPVTCSFCKHVFCKEHQTPASHSCVAYDHERQMARSNVVHLADQVHRLSLSAQSPPTRKSTQTCKLCSGAVLLHCKECGDGFCVR